MRDERSVNETEDGSGDRAAALRYRTDEATAPQVLASGKGEIARRIAEEARRAGVPVVRDPVLAESLAAAEPGTIIPPELYSAVAQVLAFLWRLDGEARSGATEGRGREKR